MTTLLISTFQYWLRSDHRPGLCEWRWSPHQSTLLTYLSRLTRVKLERLPLVLRSQTSPSRDQIPSARALAPPWSRFFAILETARVLGIGAAWRPVVERKEQTLVVHPSPDIPSSEDTKRLWNPYIIRTNTFFHAAIAFNLLSHSFSL